MPVIIILFLLNCAFATEWKVHHGPHPFVIQADQEHLSYTSNIEKIRIQKKKCNEQMFRTFYSHIRHQQSGKPLMVGSNEKDINFEIDGVKFYESPSSERGFFLTNFPKNVKKLKAQELYLCKSK